MRNGIAILFTALIFLTYRCSDSEPSNEDAGILASREDSDTYGQSEQRLCDISGSILEGNSILLREIATQLVIKADSVTFDPDYGESHRILEIYNTEDCSLLERKVLPVNESPDFPYFIAEINYNHSSKMVAIRGVSDIYCYDVAARRLLPRMTPAYVSERFGEDAQSGTIQRLELWELFLVGCATDYGAFVFDLSEAEGPQSVLPFSEYYDPVQERYHSLFLLPSVRGGVQALMPAYDREKGAFLLNPLFEAPIVLAQADPTSVRSGEKLILRDTNNQAILINMKGRKRQELSEELRFLGDVDLLNRLKQGL